MNIKFLDNSGIDEQYFIKKDLLVHSLLAPVLVMHDKNCSVNIYAGRKTNELLEQYEQSDVKKLDGIYNKMVFSEQIILVQLVKDKDRRLAQDAGYMHDAVFCVFKDELLNASPLAMLNLSMVDPKTFVQESLN